MAIKLNAGLGKKKKRTKKPAGDGTRYEEVSSATSSPPEYDKEGKEDDSTAAASDAETTEDKADNEEDEEAFIALAMERWHQSSEHESETRRLMLDDFKFSTGDQWPANIRSQRDADGRPCLTMDQLNQSIKMVTNEQRQQRPAIQINPVGSGASRQTAEMEQGLVRHIEVNSDAEVAYDTAFDHMARGGRGWIRIRTEWEDDTFKQEIKIDPVKNPFVVYDDPASIRFDGSDARFRFSIEDVPIKEYKNRFPESKMASLTNFSTIGDNATEWASKEAIRIAEYFYVIDHAREIVLLDDGTIKNADKVTEEEKGRVLKRRRAITKEVKWALINAVERLEDHKWEGSYIPLIPVVGDDIEVDGKRFIAGLVRNAKDPQRMYNYHCSAATEAVAIAPKAPFVGVIGQFASQEKKWLSANIRNFAYLEYDNVDVSGKPAPAPQRSTAEPPIQALMLMIRQAGNDIKASIGIYDASLGQPGPEQSGKAILARQKQGDVATLNFSDNLARAIRAVGRQLLELIPKIYDTPQIKRILEADGSVKMVGIFNSQNGGYSPQEALEYVQSLEGGDAIKQVYDIGVGKYDVTVSVGPSFQSKRQEAVASMIQLISSYPQLMAIAGDLLIANMDMPYADKIAKRLKASLPPALQDSDDDTPEGKIAKLSSQLQNFEQQNQMLTQALDQASELVKSKRLELESKERIALFQAQAAMVQAQLKAHSDGALAAMQASMTAIQSRLDLIHDNIGIDQEDGESAVAGAGGGGSPASDGEGTAAPQTPAPTGAPTVDDAVQSAQ